MMIVRRKIVPALAAGALMTLTAAADQQHEGFDGGEFTNPFFIHNIEFDDPCCFGFEFRQELDSFALHLRPNTDFISFDLAPDQRVRAAEITMLDFEGGFAGNRPSSFIAFRSKDDFVGFNADELGVPFTASATSETIGQINGLPLGDIVQIQIQAANEGNSEFPTEFGAYFDNIIVEVVTLAGLTGVDVTTGVILEGDVAALESSDDVVLRTRSGFGASLIDLHKMEMTVSAASAVDSPVSLDLTIESRIDEPAGTETIRLRNWNTGEFDQISSHPVGMDEEARTFPGLDASNYINTSGAGEIEARVQHVVFVPFLAFTFESFIDLVEFAVQ